jgi:hypothetical protein
MSASSFLNIIKPFNARETQRYLSRIILRLANILCETNKSTFLIYRIQLCFIPQLQRISAPKKPPLIYIEKSQPSNFQSKDFV